MVLLQVPPFPVGFMPRDKRPDGTTGLVSLLTLMATVGQALAAFPVTIFYLDLLLKVGQSSIRTARRVVKTSTSTKVSARVDVCRRRILVLTSFLC